jgi:WD40 repeat protein
LTSFDDKPVDDDDVSPTRRVEIVHESLLRAWPRLVRWQTQDADAAQIRDQLRQAARLWQAKGQPNDLLWAGTSYRELRLWRESYPGALSSTENAFVEAMIHKAKRHRRRRRIVTTVVVITALAVAVVTTSLWRRSEQHARRAEAGRLYQVGRQWIQDSPPVAFAYALASLELTDDPDVRRLAIQALTDAPLPMAVDKEQLPGRPIAATFSPDGSWLAAGMLDGGLALWQRSGALPVMWSAASMQTAVWASPDSNVLVTGGTGDTSYSCWSVPDGSHLATVNRHDGVAPGLVEGRSGNNLLRLVRIIPEPTVPGGWTVDPGPALAWRRLGQVEPRLALSPDGDRLVVAQGAELYEVAVGDDRGDPRLLGRNPVAVEHLAFHPDGRRFATFDVAGAVRLWSPIASGVEAVRSFQGPADDVCDDLRFDPSGRSIAAVFDGSFGLIWGLDDPPGADPMRLSPAGGRMTQVAFHPDGSRVVTASLRRLAVWPFDRSRFPFVLRGHAGPVEDVAFTADGSALISSSSDGTVHRWLLQPGDKVEPGVLFDWGHKVEGVVSSTSLSGDGRFVVATGGEDVVHVLSTDGGLPRTFGGFDLRVLRAALSADGLKLAVPGSVAGQKVIRIWDLETGADSALDLREIFPSTDGGAELIFTGDGDLLVADTEMLVRCAPDTGDHTVLGESVGEFASNRDGSILISRTRIDDPDDDRATVHDLRTGAEIPLTSHGIGVLAVAVDPTGSIVVTGNRDGFIRVGRATGEPPYHLMSNQGVVLSLAVSPDGRWIASGGGDGTIRLWPMPDLSKPPIHELPYRDFLAKLKSLTNLRVVPDAENPGKYVVRAAAPFPGWETVPEW